MLKESYDIMRNLLLKEDFASPKQLAKVSKYLIDNGVKIYKEVPEKLILVQGPATSAIAGQTMTIKIENRKLVVKFEGTTREPLVFEDLKEFGKYLKKNLLIA